MFRLRFEVRCLSIFVEAGSLTALKLTNWLDRMSSNSGIPSVSSFLVSGFQAFARRPRFFSRCWAWKSGY